MTSSLPPKADWEADCQVQRTRRQQVARAQETEQGDMAAAWPPSVIVGTV